MEKDESIAKATICVTKGQIDVDLEGTWTKAMVDGVYIKMRKGVIAHALKMRNKSEKTKEKGK